jgi:FkbM family methyltransferase
VLFSLAVLLLRSWEAWPFPRGRYIAFRIVTGAIKLGLIRPKWQNIGGAWHWIDLDDFICQRLAIGGHYERAVPDAIIRSLPVSGTFIDVGANIGYISVLASRRVGPGGRVLAIEPSPQVLPILRATIQRNESKNVSIVELACSHVPGNVTFFMTDRSNLGRGSLSQQNAGCAQSVEVRRERLDAIVAAHQLDRIDVVKIDVEGAELQVLRGMHYILAKCHPIIVIEVKPLLLASFGTTPSDIDEFFRVRGYRCQRIDSDNLLFRFTAPSRP